MLGTDTLKGSSFVDIGCGSGLFSLVARRLGAKAHSFDYDPQSVNCASELRNRYFPNDPEWTVEAGSALDWDYLKSLGAFDVVYSWGAYTIPATWRWLWRMQLVWSRPVASSSLLFTPIKVVIAAGGFGSKDSTTDSSKLSRSVIVGLCIAHFWWKPLLADLLSGHPGRSWKQYQENRGMYPVHDAVDWVGGYPFEVATPELIFDFYRDRGFSR